MKPKTTHRRKRRRSKCRERPKLPRLRLTPYAWAKLLYLRDRGRCAYVSDDGRRCNERRHIEFHHLILEASGNDMFCALREVITEVLSGRTHQGLMPRTTIGVSPSSTRPRARALRSRAIGSSAAWMRRCSRLFSSSSSCSSAFASVVAV